MMTEIHTPPGFIDESLFNDDFDAADKAAFAFDERQADLGPDESVASSAMEAILAETSDLPLLTPHQEKTLAAKIQRGDGEALHALVTHNLRLIPYFMGPFKERGVEEDDLFMEGVFGLQQAAANFDPEIGTRFTTYAAPKIKRAMQASTENQGHTVRIPKEVHWRKHSINTAQKSLQESGVTAKIDDISEFTGLSPRQIQEVLRAFAMQPLSLNYRIAGTAPDSRSSTEIQELAVSRPHVIGGHPEDAVETIAQTDRTRALYGAITVLEERERKVIDMHYGLGGIGPKSFQEIGDALGVTDGRAQQIEARALEKMAAITALKDAAHDPDNFEPKNSDPQYFSNLIKEWGVQPIEGLTDRMTAVAYLLSEGRTNPEMSRILNVNIGSVKDALKSVYERVGADDSDQSSKKRQVARVKLSSLIELREAA